MDIESSEIYGLRGAQKILLIFPYFKKIYIPTYDKGYAVEESRNVLKKIFENNISTSGQIFLIKVN